MACYVCHDVLLALVKFFKRPQYIHCYVKLNSNKFQLSCVTRYVVTEPRLLGWELGAKPHIHYEKHHSGQNLQHNKRICRPDRENSIYILIPGLQNSASDSGITNLAIFLTILTLKINLL